MTRRTRRLTTHAASAFLCLLLPGGAAALQRSGPSSIVIVTGQDAPWPIPTLMEGSQANQANFEVADQLFLRLAAVGPTLLTTGDGGFVPQLARRWVRRDSVTLAFELDPRARWHDGAPVTARDVLFTLKRARNPALCPTSALLLRHVTAVEAEGERTVVFRFARPYAEQLYDAVHHVAPLPSHLLDTVPPRRFRESAYVRRPVGSGPYRWVRRARAELIELRSNEAFFLGKPGIERVVIRVAADPDARINLLLSGEADAVDNIPPPPSNQRRVSDRPELRVLAAPSPMVGFLLYNQRDPRDLTRPHPILADTAVRRALTLALDRQQMVRAVLGRYGEVPYGPVSSVLWIRHGAPRPSGHDQAAARQLLAARGWADRNGDGILERNGQPLALRLNYPGTSSIRKHMALMIQEQWRRIGVRAVLVQLDGPVWNERREAGAFDVDFSGTMQDPTPSGLAQGWSCAGTTNVAKYCDPVVDSLLERAMRGGEEPARAWHEVLRRIEESSPATFLYSALNLYGVHRRYENVSIRPLSSWSALWRWSVRSGEPGRTVAR